MRWFQNDYGVARAYGVACAYGVARDYGVAVQTTLINFLEITHTLNNY